MKKHLTLSNLIFVVALAVLLHKPTRAWVIRQVSFSPSVEEASDNKKISDYNWELVGLNSGNINFKKLEGKVVFLNFWATWCPPCIAEMPSIQEFYNSYKNKVAFVFVTNDSWEVVEQFYKENGYDLPTYTSISSHLLGLPNVNSIPATFVIDKKGYIRVQKTGSADWDSVKFKQEIDKLLKQ